MMYTLRPLTTFFFQAEDGIRDRNVTGVQTCALPISVALLGERQSSPIAAYRWQHTDQALAEQLEIEGEGHPATVGAGHAAVRFSNPTTGGDVMPTIRAEFHRLRAGAVSALRREVGSSVWQVFAGSGSVWLGGTEHCLERGDLFVVPSWAEHELTAGKGMDLF